LPISPLFPYTTLFRSWQRAIDDVRIRQALAFSLDKAELADALQHGFGGPADTGYPEGLPIRARLDQVIAKYPYDPQRAETLFNQDRKSTRLNSSHVAI